MQRCAPIVTEEISKELIGECWTYQCFNQTSA